MRGGRWVPGSLVGRGLKVRAVILSSGSRKQRLVANPTIHGHHQIPMDVINKIAAMSPPTSKKEAQAFLGGVGFWRMHMSNYSQIVSSLYQMTQKKNNFGVGP